MKLFFLRHGMAGDSGEWRGNDFDRPLTAEGIRLMESEAKSIARMSLGIDLIVTSPFARALESARIVAEGLGMRDGLTADDRLGSEFDMARLKAILSERPRAQAVMLVGHEPNLGSIVGALTGGGRVELKKGSLACVRLEEASSSKGELEFLLPAGILAR